MQSWAIAYSKYFTFSSIFELNVIKLSIKLSLENKSGYHFMEKLEQVWNLWKEKGLMPCQDRWKGAWSGSLRFFYSNVVHEQKYAKNKTDINQQRIKKW